MDIFKSTSYQIIHNNCAQIQSNHFTNFQFLVLTTVTSTACARLIRIWTSSFFNWNGCYLKHCIWLSFYKFYDTGQTEFHDWGYTISIQFVFNCTL